MGQRCTCDFIHQVCHSRVGVKNQGIAVPHLKHECQDASPSLCWNAPVNLEAQVYLQYNFFPSEGRK